MILAGQFELTPNGNGIYIKTNPDATSEHPVTLRCQLAIPSCAEFTPDKKNPQLDPPGAIEGKLFVGQDAIEDDVKERLKERAIADGRYYHNACPTDEQLSGKVVWVEGCPHRQVHEELTSGTAPTNARHPDLGGRRPRARRQVRPSGASSTTSTTRTAPTTSCFGSEAGSRSTAARSWTAPAESTSARTA